MSDEKVKRAAQEYLAEKVSKEGLTSEQTLNRDAAIALAPAVWRQLAEAVVAMCNEWNAVTKEQSLRCRETMLGDLGSGVRAGPTSWFSITRPRNV
jgi:hypothetical protein